LFDQHLGVHLLVDHGFLHLLLAHLLHLQDPLVVQGFVELDALGTVDFNQTQNQLLGQFGQVVQFVLVGNVALAHVGQAPLRNRVVGVAAGQHPEEQHA